jgi:hypothetical protein
MEQRGDVGAIEGSLETLSMRAVKAICGHSGAAMIGCSTEQGGPNLIYLNQLILHAQSENERRASVFFSEVMAKDTHRGHLLLRISPPYCIIPTVMFTL